MNLLDNAVKFTPSGRIWLAASGEEHAVRFSIHDTGVGIPPEARERIFQAFCQLDDVSTRRFDGVGIGLSIVRLLVDAIGASVAVESIEGEGAEFIVQVPLEEGKHESRSGCG